MVRSSLDGANRSSPVIAIVDVAITVLRNCDVVVVVVVVVAAAAAAAAAAVFFGRFRFYEHVIGWKKLESKCVCF